MRHMKNKEELEFDREQKELDRRKKKPKRYKQNPVDRNIAFNENELGKYSPSEPVSKEVRSQSIKKIITAAAICLLCAFLVFMYANKDSFSFEAVSNWFNYELLGKNNGAGFPVKINGNTVNPENIDIIDGKYLAYVSDSNSVALKQNGSVLYDRRLTYSNPVARTNGTYNLIYSLDGKKYQVSTVGEVKIDSQTDDDIFYGAINKNGVFGLITKTDGYLSRLIIYDNKGKEIYSYYFSQYYAYCLDIRDDGKQALVGAVSSKNGKVLSAVYLIDFSSKEPQALTTFDNSTIYGVKYLSSGVAAVICDDSLAIYNARQNTIVKNSYNGRVLADCCINKQTGCVALALSRSGDGRMCDIDYYNSTGEKEASIETGLEIKSIDLYKNKIAVLSDGMVYEFDKLGQQLYCADAGGDSKAIKLIDDRNLYVIGISEARKLDLANPSEQSDLDAEH